MRLGRTGVAVVVVMASVLVVPAAGAAPAQAPGELTWVGPDGGRWSVAANWTPARIPVDGDTLLFQGRFSPSNPPQNEVYINDLTGLRVEDLRLSFGDYVLFGNAVTLDGDIVVLGPHTVGLPLVLTPGDHAFDGQIADFPASISGPGGVVIQDTGGGPSEGAISFTAGNPNSYTGGTTVLWHLGLHKVPGVTAVPSGRLTVVRPFGISQGSPHQVADDAEIELLSGSPSPPEFGGFPTGGWYSIYPRLDRPVPEPFERVGPLTAGDFAFLNLGSSYLNNRPSVLATGPLDVGNADLHGILRDDRLSGLRVTGPADISGTRLDITSVLAPATGRTYPLVDNDGADPVAGRFAGLPEGWVLAAPEVGGGLGDPPTGRTHYLRISYVGGDGNDVTLTTVSDAEGQVRRSYQLVLGRQPDPGGLAYWTGFIRDRGQPGAVPVLLAASRDGQARAVDVGYQEVLGRSPDPGGRAYWTDVLVRRGGVGLFRAALLASPEYAARPDRASNAGFVAALYREPTILDREPDGGGLAFWSGKLDRGELSRFDVALTFLTSWESALLNGGRAFEVVNPWPPTAQQREAAAFRYLGTGASHLATVAALLGERFR